MRTVSKSVICGLRCLVAGLLLLGLGCSKKPAQPDPVAAIQDRVRYVENYFNVDHKEDYMKGSLISHCTVREISYDVEKTNSLVSPFSGTIEFLILENNAPSLKEKVQLAWQDGRWVVKRVTVLDMSNGEWRDFELPQGQLLKAARDYLGLD
jgi:hypothetical protein